MKYLSLCSGIEAATVAWHPLGWKPVAFSEIEKFPSEVLAHHYPDVPNLGDMTQFKEWNYEQGSIDLVVGGTPCQSFSVAGLRKGLEDPRGNLALTFCGILNKFRPKWFVWENVPGVLSSGGGRDFGSFLGALVKLGYGFSYRVLDAQYFGVAQRRRRVFVVGHLGDWRPTAEVLFESESLQRNIKPSRKEEEDSPGFIETGFGAYRQSTVGGTTKASGGVLGGGSETFIHVADKAPTLTSSAAGISRVGNDTTANSQYIAQAFHATQDPIVGKKSPCLGATSKIGVAYNITFNDANGTRKDRPNGGMYVNETNVSNTITQAGVGTFPTNMRVRRLTPIECERLQGFPDGYTDVREKCPDGPRYKALGNSMAVPVMRWIGQRIEAQK
jgi:DNA (cytosine-5)-methyltransferase 1